ncbi:MAG: MTH938/NDUFAF3 family protein [Pseudomonadota bacterium]
MTTDPTSRTAAGTLPGPEAAAGTETDTSQRREQSGSGVDGTPAPNVDSEQRLPFRAPIDAYGNGGFRFADIGHRGGLLILPDGMRAWPVTTPQEFTASAFAAAIAASKDIEVFLLGTGQEHHFLAPELLRQLRADGLRVETMTTGAACRTYNVLLAEQRQVSAGLLATV